MKVQAFTMPIPEELLEGEELSSSLIAAISEIAKIGYYAAEIGGNQEGDRVIVFLYNPDLNVTRKLTEMFISENGDL